MDTITITLSNGSTIAASGKNMLALNHELGSLSDHWKLIACDVASVIGDESKAHDIATEAGDRAYETSVCLWCNDPLPDYAARSETQDKIVNHGEYKISDEYAGHSG